MLQLDVQVKNNLVESVTVDMGHPKLAPADIPTSLATENGSIIDYPIEFNGVALNITTVSMGNPHCIIFVPEATDELVLGLGPIIENDSRFPEKTNVEFVEVLSRTELRQRTWERGSGETWACGTGASAVCVAGVLTGRTETEVGIELRGGRLRLRFDRDRECVFMTGPAVEVFNGQWPN